MRHSISHDIHTNELSFISLWIMVGGIFIMRNIVNTKKENMKNTIDIQGKDSLLCLNMPMIEVCQKGSRIIRDSKSPFSSNPNRENKIEKKGKSKPYLKKIKFIVYVSQVPKSEVLQMTFNAKELVRKRKVDNIKEGITYTIRKQRKRENNSSKNLYMPLTTEDRITHYIEKLKPHHQQSKYPHKLFEVLEYPKI